MNESKVTIEQTVDILIEGARKTSNTFMLETAKLIKAALIIINIQKNQFLN